MTLGLYMWYYFSAIVLAALLYRPVRNIIVGGRVRRFERTQKRESTEEERSEIQKKAIPLVSVIVVTFSLLFTRFLVVKYFLER